MKQTLITIASVILIFYISYVFLAYSVQNAIVFPGQFRSIYPKNDPLVCYPQIRSSYFEIDTFKVESWFIDKSSKNLLIYTHGNNTIIDDLPERLIKLSEHDFDILITEYPGFGRSTGFTSKVSIRKSQIKAFLALENKYDKIIGYGRSLGGGVILDLADDIDFDGIILESTFSDLKSFTPKLLLPKFILKTDYDNIKTVTKFRNPVLIFHSVIDKTVPYDNATILNNAAHNSTLITYNNKHDEPPKNLEKHYDLIFEFVDNILKTDE